MRTEKSKIPVLQGIPGTAVDVDLYAVVPVYQGTKKSETVNLWSKMEVGQFFLKAGESFSQRDRGPFHSYPSEV